MKRVLYIILLALFAIPSFAQTGWKCDRYDFGNGNEYFCTHQTKGVDDARFYLDDEVLHVFKFYKGKQLYDLAIQKGILKNKRIEDRKVDLEYTLNGLFNNQPLEDEGYFMFYDMDEDEDPYIKSPGFFCKIRIKIKPNLLKDANSITLEFEDPITQNATKVTLSLTGFTKAYKQAFRYTYQ